MGDNSLANRLCYMAPYCDILSQYGFDISEEYLLGLARGLIFKYSYIHKNKQVEKPLSMEDWVSIVGSKNEIDPAIADDFGVEFYEKIIDDALFAAELCREELQEGRYIIIFVDTYYLKYHPQYLNTHGQTNVVIYGWKSKEKCFLFRDNHVTTIPPSTYNGCLMENEFTQALITGDNPYNDRIRGLVLNRRVSKGVGIDIFERVRENAKEMLIPGSPYSGVDGIFGLADEMESWLNFWSADAIQHVLRQGYHHVTGRGGPAISRGVYAEFIEKYIHCKNIDKDLIRQGFTEAARGWNAVGAKFFRGSVGSTKKKFIEIPEALRTIGNLERELFEKLLNIG